MAVADLDFSFLDTPQTQMFGRFDERPAGAALAQEDLFGAHDMSFPLAPVADPSHFCEDVSKAGVAPGLMDFKKGTTTLGFCFQGGIIIAVDSRASMGSYIGSQTVRKVIEINDQLLGTMAGGAADCSFWERRLALLCRLSHLRNKEKPSVAAASKILGNIFYNYKGQGLSCGTMVAGHDLNGTHLYMVDDQGDRMKGNLFSVGSGSTYAYGVLDSGYKWDLTLDEAVELGKKSIYHATHRDGASGGVVRVYHVHDKGWTKMVEGDDVNELHYKYAAEKGCVGDE